MRCPIYGEAVHFDGKKYKPCYISSVTVVLYIVCLVESKTLWPNDIQSLWSQ